MTKLTLKNRDKSKLDAFLDDFWKVSSAHPFNPRVRILHNTMIELSPFGDEIHMGDILAMEPNKGHGTKALTELKKLADKHGVVISGTAVAYLNDPKYINKTAALKKWYKKNGFKMDYDDVRYVPKGLKEEVEELDETLKVEVGNGASEFTLYKDGKEIGNASVNPSRKAPYLTNIYIGDEVQGKGIGKFFYDEINKAVKEFYGKELIPSPLGVSDKAARVWKSRLKNTDSKTKVQMAFDMYRSGQMAGVNYKHITPRIDKTLREKLGADDDVVTWIRHFRASKNSRFDGDSKKQRWRRAVAAWMKSREKAGKLDEALDKVLPYVRKETSRSDNRYVFQTDSFRTYEVTIDYESYNRPNMVNVAFADSQGNINITGQGKEETFSILATVGAIVADYVKKHKPDQISFLGNKSEDSRVNLYKILAPRLAKAIKYVYRPDLDGESIYDETFYLMKPSYSKGVKKGWGESLDEAFYDSVERDYGKREIFDIFKNPTSKELKEIDPEKTGQFRAWIDSNDMYAWNTYGDLHTNVKKHIKGFNNNFVSIVVYYDKRECSIEVTDATKYSKWFHNPSIKDFIHENDALHKLFPRIDGISFFDDTIYGDWEEITDEEELDEAIELKQITSNSWKSPKGGFVVVKQNNGTFNVMKGAKVISKGHKTIGAARRIVSTKMRSLKEETLEEAKTAPLYHNTSATSMMGIIEKDILRDMTQQAGDMLFGSDNRRYYNGVSLTRDPYFAKTWNGSIVLKLDQEKLSKNHKIIPFNYFNHPSMRRENEEFLLGPIKNVSKYISEIYLDQHPRAGTNIFEFHKKIVEWAKENNIPVRNYTRTKKGAPFVTEEVIEEGREAPLYHATSLDYITDILADNVLLAKTRHHGAKLLNKNLYTAKGVSLSRNFKFISGWGAFVIELDQRKLAYKHQIVPIDFWNNPTRPIKDRFMSRNSADGNFSNFSNNYEFEEFVVGNIEDLSKYIKRIYVTKESSFVPAYYSNGMKGEVLKILNAFVKLTTEKGIKVIGMEKITKEIEDLKAQGINEEVLEEGRDASLFHATGMHSFTSIIASDKLLGSTEQYSNKLLKMPLRKRPSKSPGEDPIHYGGGETRKGVSLTRHFGFAGRWGSIIFEIDQRKLAHNYEILPFHYWSTPKFAGYTQLSAGSNEYEEFVLGDIKNLSKYVKAIWVRTQTFSLSPSGYAHQLIEVAKYASEKGVPVYWYDGEKESNTMRDFRKKKPVKLETLERISKMADTYVEFEKLINEGRDAPLYHATYLSNVPDIITSDTLKAKTSHGNDVTLRNRATFTRGISTTRSFPFASSWSAVIFELDQTKISKRHEIIPVDYFLGKRKGWMNVGVGSHEYEEFVVGDLKNLSKYVKAIYVRASYLDGSDKSAARMLKKWADEKGIPIYNNERNPKSGNFNKRAASAPITADQLTEGRDAPLYHATSIENLINILDEKMLEGVTSHENHKLGLAGHRMAITNGVSLSRSMQFVKNWNHVIIELNQRKLAQRFKIRTLDYFGNDVLFRRGKSDSHKQGAEAEEFVIGDITDVTKYINSITLNTKRYFEEAHALMSAEGVLKELDTFLKKIKENNIPLKNEKEVLKEREKLVKFVHKLYTEETLEEGRDAPLYHATKLSFVERILDSNMLAAQTNHPSYKLLKSKSKSVMDRNAGNRGVSLTRDLAFAKKWGEIVFKLDQRKITYNHQIVPMDYFANLRRTSEGHHARKENEEYLLGPLEDLSKYVLSVILNPYEVRTMWEYRYWIQIIKKLKEFNYTIEGMKVLETQMETFKEKNPRFFTEENLDESKSAPLYHATELRYVVPILKTDTLKAVTSHTSKKLMKGKDSMFFGVSLTRSLKFAEFWGDAIFEIDQEKLIANKKLVPINFFNSSEHPDLGENGMGRREAEEFALGDITNFSRYVKGVIINVKRLKDMMQFLSLMDLRDINVVMDALREKRIPIKNEKEVQDFKAKLIMRFKKMKSQVPEFEEVENSKYELVVEGRDAPLYHATTIDGLEGIIKKDVMLSDFTKQSFKKLLKPESAKKHKNFFTHHDSEKDPEYLYLKGVSLTRNFRFASYWKNYILELDQRKLDHRHEILPIHFWNATKGDPETIYADQFNPEWGANEYEEFVVGDVKNIKKYIKAIYIRSSYLNAPNAVKHLPKFLVDYARENRIPLYMFARPGTPKAKVMKLTIPEYEQDETGQYKLNLEDAPVTNIGSGNIAGAQGDPPITLKKKKKKKSDDIDIHTNESEKGIAS